LFERQVKPLHKLIWGMPANIYPPHGERTGKIKMAKAKGMVLMSRISVIKENYGEDGLKAVLDRMKPEHRKFLENIIASSWYDGEIFKDFNLALKKALSQKDPDVMDHVGAFTAESSLKGIYSSQLKAGDVRSTLLRAPSLWKMFHDTGELTVDLDKERNHAILRIAGYALPHEENCANLIGWGRRMVELSGGKNVRISEDKCVCKGDDLCEMSFDWD
jgi:hypothetical protein